MPTITDPHLLSVLQWCDDWIEITRSEIDDIGAWRGVAWKYDFSHRPHDLHRIAIGLSQHVTTAYPSLSPTAIHDTYTHIEMWYKDRSASNLPSQSVLESTLERSLFVAASVRDDILVKAGAYGPSPQSKAESGGQPADKADDKPKRPKATVEALMFDLVQRDPSTHILSSQQFADRLGCSKAAVAGTKVWKSLRISREMARQDRAKKAYRKNQGRS